MISTEWEFLGFQFPFWIEKHCLEVWGKSVSQTYGRVKNENSFQINTTPKAPKATSSISYWKYSNPFILDLLYAFHRSDIAPANGSPQSRKSSFHQQTYRCCEKKLPIFQPRHLHKHTHTRVLSFYFLFVFEWQIMMMAIIIVINSFDAPSQMMVVKCAMRWGECVCVVYVGKGAQRCIIVRCWKGGEVGRWGYAFQTQMFSKFMSKLKQKSLTVFKKHSRPAWKNK